MNEAWYISRAAGFAAYVLLFLVVASGLAIHTRASDRLLARWRVSDLHEFGSILALAFVTLHAGILLADSYVGYSVVQILVPFTASTRAAWTAVGIFSGYLLAIVVLSFYVRRWIGYRTWRLVHYSTVVLFATAALHGIFTGTDSVTTWAQLLYVVTGGTVVALVIYRAVTASRPRGRRAQATPRLSVRALGWGVTASAVAAVGMLASGLGPFKWFGESETAQTVPLSAQTVPGTNTGVAAAPASIELAPAENHDADTDHADDDDDASASSLSGDSKAGEHSGHDADGHHSDHSHDDSSDDD